MRKLLNIIGLSTVVLMASSCEMDRMPHGFGETGGDFKDIQSIEYLENGAYARLRDNYITSSVLTADIQADYVNAITGFSNTFGDHYKWTFIQENPEISDTWNKCYLTIAMCNYILNNTEALVDGPDSYDGTALARLMLVRGRVALMRALSYSMLAERFCADYDDATAKAEHSGVPLLRIYDPKEKPGRASLYDVYDLILKDIEVARTALSAQKGAANSVRLNIDCVTAFAAHVYLQMDMPNEALKEANSLIGNTTYSLAVDMKEFDDAWTYDRGNEIIFKFAASKTELPDPYAQPFFYDQANGTGESESDKKKAYFWSPDYIPTKALIDSFEADDYRLQSWFFTGFSGDLYQNFYAGPYIIQNPTYVMLAKFSGNPDLRTSESWNYANAWKLFRIAEMYLIAAEAAVQTGGDANTPLNTLRRHRGLKDLPNNVTMADVKAERHKELLLEGYRLTDLKRWGDGMQRGEGQRGTFYKIGPTGEDGNASLIKQKEDFLSIPTARDLTVAAGDFRFVWPIPYSEIFANQNLAGQQNPGWEVR